MKKVSFSFMLLLAALVFFSCASAPDPEPVAQAPAPVPAPAPAPTPAAPPPPPPAPAPAQLEPAGPIALDLAGAQQHTVEEGDTLSAIARRFFGDFAAVDYAGTRNGFFFPVIITASGISITNSDFIEVGVILTIPDLQRNLDSPAARRAVRYSLLEATTLYGIRDRPLEEESLRRLADSL